MSILVLILIGTLGIIYYTSYRDVFNKDQAMLERYIDANFNGLTNRRSVMLKDGRFEKRIYSEKVFLLSTFFSVTVSDSGEVLQADNIDSTTYSMENVTELTKKLISNGKMQGTTGSLIYRIEAGNGYTLVAFMDNTIFSESITTLFKCTMIFGGVAIVLLFFLSVYLAKRIVMPIEEAIKSKNSLFLMLGMN